MIIIYYVEKNVEKVLNGESTNFIEIKYLGKIKNKLKNIKYEIYIPFSDATKVIIYKNKKVDIKVFEIESKVPIRHQDILGTLYSLNISDEMFGDVVCDNGKYFIIVVSSIENYLKSNMLSIRNSNINLVERKEDYLINYNQKFEEIILIVTSTRMDSIVSKIVNTSRNNALNLLKNGDVFLNYEELTKPTYILKENDIFSVRKYGKYKFSGIINNTKKGNLVIKILKYV